MARYSLKSYSVPPLSGVWTDLITPFQNIVHYTHYQDCVIPRPTVNFQAIWDGKISSLTLTRKSNGTIAAEAGVEMYIEFGDASDVVRLTVYPGNINLGGYYYTGSMAVAIGGTRRLIPWVGDLAKVRLKMEIGLGYVGGGCDVGITVAASQVHVYSEC